MKPREIIGTASAPGGGELVLAREADAWVIRVDGHALMSSRVHGSEETMAKLACEPVRSRPGARALIGGLGLGYTLRAALDELEADARVTVAELVPAVVTWNRGPLGHLAGHPLDDPRVLVEERDVAEVIRASPGVFDAILLDVDNGPASLTSRANQWLYTAAGLEAARRALRRPGMLVVWSAAPDVAFEKRLRQAGFGVEVRTVSARGNVRRGSRHTLFVAGLELSPSTPASRRA